MAHLPFPGNGALMIDTTKIKYGDIFQPIISNNLVMFIAWADDRSDGEGSTWFGVWVSGERVAGLVSEVRGLRSMHNGGPFWAQVTVDV